MNPTVSSDPKSRVLHRFGWARLDFILLLLFCFTIHQPILSALRRAGFASGAVTGKAPLSQDIWNAALLRYGRRIGSCLALIRMALLMVVPAVYRVIRPLCQAGPVYLLGFATITPRQADEAGCNSDEMLFQLPAAVDDVLQSAPITQVVVALVVAGPVATWFLHALFFSPFVAKHLWKYRLPPRGKKTVLGVERDLAVRLRTGVRFCIGVIVVCFLPVVVVCVSHGPADRRRLIRTWFAGLLVQQVALPLILTVLHVVTLRLALHTVSWDFLLRTTLGSRFLLATLRWPHSEEVSQELHTLRHKLKVLLDEVGDTQDINWGQFLDPVDQSEDGTDRSEDFEQTDDTQQPSGKKPGFFGRLAGKLRKGKQSTAGSEGQSNGSSGSVSESVVSEAI